MQYSRFRLHIKLNKSREDFQADSNVKVDIQAGYKLSDRKRWSVGSVLTRIADKTADKCDSRSSLQSDLEVFVKSDEQKA